MSASIAAVTVDVNAAFVIVEVVFKVLAVRHVSLFHSHISHYLFVI